MAGDARAGAIMSGIIDLGRRLGSLTIAEGLESAAQVTDVRQLGCHLGQGYHFAAPMLAADLADQLILDGPHPFGYTRRTPARRAVTG
jgi:EAL domain-containing protein (putative c-di-GMP-specific phosphodiesterase class I)